MHNQHLLQKRVLQFLFFIMLTLPVLAQEKKDSTIPISPAKSFVTTHKGTFGGKPISYKATASEMHLKNDKDEPVASIWSVAYTEEGLTDLNKKTGNICF